MRPRYVVRISPQDVGRRVSVRARLTDVPDDAPGPHHSDVLGRLEAWEDGHLLIRRRDGEVVRLPEAHLVAGRVVPDSPPRRGRRLS